MYKYDDRPLKDALELGKDILEARSLSCKEQDKANNDIRELEKYLSSLTPKVETISDSMMTVVDGEGCPTEEILITLSWEPNDNNKWRIYFKSEDTEKRPLLECKLYERLTSAKILYNLVMDITNNKKKHLLEISNKEL